MLHAGHSVSHPGARPPVASGPATEVETFTATELGLGSRGASFYYGYVKPLLCAFPTYGCRKITSLNGPNGNASQS